MTTNQPSGPDFFIVGAPKCGTTALTHYLRQHPDVFIPADKEFHYFGSDIVYEDVFRNIRDREEYFAQFEAANPGQVIGETSTMNLYSERAAREIHDYNPEARIIIMLRNPVDLLHSLHSHYLFGGNEDIQDFREALEAEPDRKQGERLPGTVRFREGLYYREMVRFDEQVKRYLDVFEKRQIHFILFDEFRDQTETVYRHTLEFLELTPIESVDLEPVNVNKQVLSRTLNRFVREPPEPVRSLVQVIDKFLPSWLFRAPVRRVYRWLNTRPTSREPIDPEFRNQLREAFKPMLKSLESLIDRDLSDWYEPQEPR